MTLPTLQAKLLHVSPVALWIKTLDQSSFYREGLKLASACANREKEEGPDALPEAYVPAKRPVPGARKKKTTNVFESSRAQAAGIGPVRRTFAFPK